MKNNLSVVIPAYCTPIPNKGYVWAVKSAHGPELWRYLVISEKFNKLFFTSLGS